MESSNFQFQAVNVTLHGRNQHPTQTLQQAVFKAKSEGSKIVRVYGIPQLVIDPDTKLVYLGHQFSKDITEKILDGTLAMPKGIQTVIDEETQERIKNKEKRRLKSSTKVYRKR